MTKKYQHLKERIRGDRGDAIAVFFLFLFIILITLSTFLIDMQKAVYMKGAYQENAQQATRTALKHQNSIGGVTGGAVSKAVEEYLTLRGDVLKGQVDTSNTRPFRGYCDKLSEYPKITVTLDKGRAFGNTDEAVSYSYVGKDIPTDLDGLDFQDKDYKVIHMKVTDIMENTFSFPLGACREITVTASSVSATHYDED